MECIAGGTLLHLLHFLYCLPMIRLCEIAETRVPVYFNGTSEANGSIEGKVMREALRRVHMLSPTSLVELIDRYNLKLTLFCTVFM